MMKMDTRAKVLDGPVAPAAGTVYVTGYFDPLLATHARRLLELAGGGKRLVVLLADPPEPLLGTRSRAELVASLGCVEVVVMPNPDGSAQQVAGAIQETESDLERRQALVAEVHRRHADG
jgi:glycerol-3-phosphate cytidylyltransferase-like family protein